MRKLASVQKVLDILPIEGADNIELALVNGWQCIVKKGEFQPGHFGVYFEIDSVVPDTEPFKFLKSRRIKTMKLRGQLSQGLMMPFTALPPMIVVCPVGVEHKMEGDDLTELLGVTKYDPEPEPGMSPLKTKRESDFPSNIPKTDEERIQSCPALLYKLRGKPYVITLKCDGSSGTYTMHDGKFTVCSRNYVVAEDDSAFWRVARKYPGIQQLVSHYWKYYDDQPELALQGEVIGPGIQKNRHGLADVEFRAFGIFDKREQRYWSDDLFRSTCQYFGIPTAPKVAGGLAFDYTMESLLELAEGKYEGTNNEREGIVVRSLDTTPHARVSFKVISNRYLLKLKD